LRQTDSNPEIVPEDSIDQMLFLAERIRTQHGGEMDESAIQAVAEATGAPVEYVRLAVKLRTEKEKRSLLSNIRSQFLTMEPDTRRFVVTGTLASGAALFGNIEEKVDLYRDSALGVFGMLGFALGCLAIYYIGISRERKTAAIAGAVFGGVFYLMRSLFAAAMGLTVWADPAFFVPVTALGAVAAVVLHKMVSRNRDRLGLRDPATERQDLLRQLHELREKLHSGQQGMTFLSVDIVGSTRMKQVADPLAVEFTFNEYHHFVERVTEKHGGRVHSTAGDGVISAFDSAYDAFTAAKHLQAGLLELNTFRNKLGTPIVLRCGIHSGTVVAPTAGDVTSVNFSEVIDIAANLQKASPPGGIVISDDAAMSMPGGVKAVGDRKVEAANVPGVVWEMKAPTTFELSSPPPSPQSVRTSS